MRADHIVFAVFCVVDMPGTPLAVSVLAACDFHVLFWAMLRRCECPLRAGLAFDPEALELGSIVFSMSLLGQAAIRVFVFMRLNATQQELRDFVYSR